MTFNTISDPRILAGMKDQFGARATKLAGGAEHLGWKAGFGAPAALKQFAIDGPLTGFLLQSSILQSGATADLKGWVKPVAEPEIAIYLGQDIADGAERSAVAQAIAAVGPAIELADLAPPPERIETILAGNIFHRHVILGPRSTDYAGGDISGLTGLLTRQGKQQQVEDLEANTGKLVDIVGHMAKTLAACGELLRSGDVIIAGSTTAPLMLETSDAQIKFSLDGIGDVSISLNHG